MGGGFRSSPQFDGVARGGTPPRASAPLGRPLLGAELPAKEKRKLCGSLLVVPFRQFLYGCSPGFREGPDYTSEEEAERPLPHQHLVSGLHPWRPLPLEGRALGLGCGLSIVASRSFLPYPGALARPSSAFRPRLGGSSVRNFPHFDGVAATGRPPKRGRPIPLARIFPNPAIET